jgi:hypothetical protein
LYGGFVKGVSVYHRCALGFKCTGTLYIAGKKGDMVPLFEKTFAENQADIAATTDQKKRFTHTILSFLLVFIFLFP